MTGPEYPAPPPDLPEEYAQIYREAYQRALAEQSAAPASEPAESTILLAPPVTAAFSRWRASRWFVPVAVATGAVLLVAAAYAVGTTVSGHDEPGTSGAMAPRSSHTTDSTHPASPGSKRPTREATAAHGWTGPVRPVGIDAIAADCTAPPGSDAAGRTVTYVPQNATDGKADTAWRCTGTAVGERLVLRLSGPADVAEVGLVPGYAKTDPESGADRYAENNRITRVRWTFGDGVSVVQRLDPDPSLRAPQLLRVPRTTTDRVTLEILAVKKGPRNTTAISEIRLAEAS
jgi:hypothetical protein